MSGHQFTFPPPPPAPPKASQSYPSVPQPFAGPNGHRGREDSRDYANRGHSQGFNRGARRGGHFGPLQSNSSYGDPSLNIDKRHSSPPGAGYNVLTNDYRRIGYPLLTYPSVQLPQFPINLHHGYGPQNPAFPANARPPQPAHPANRNISYQSHNGQHHYPSRGYGPPAPTIQAPLPAAQTNNSSQTNMHAGQPILMGPPIRMGFDALRNGSQSQQHAQLAADGTNAYQRGPSDSNETPYRRRSPMGFGPGRHEFPNAFPANRGRGQNRGHGASYNRPRTQKSRTPAAPAVPSFGGPLPLPVKPPTLHGTTRKPKKKKRRHNQLGLTPKAEEHESSEEEDDTDEEARLAAVAGSTGQDHQLLQFDYKGRTSTLQSSSDITAWIEERKKRYPTKARTAAIEEGKRQRKDERGAIDQNSKGNQDMHRTEVRKRKSWKTDGEKQQKRAENAPEDATAKAKRKVEKLRLQLEKEERRIAKAEAQASKDKLENSAEVERLDASAPGNDKRKRKRSDSGELKDAKIEDANSVKPKPQEAVSMGSDPLTPTSQPALADEEGKPSAKVVNANSAPGQFDSSTGQEGDGPSFPDTDRSIHDSTFSQSDLSSESSLTESEDDTSSSGSSSDSDSDDGAPNETSTKRNGPERVAPPKRARPKQICRAFLQKGLCKRGSFCKYLHELPERGSRGAGFQDVKRGEGREKRVGLYQRLVEQEKEQEDHEIVEAIVYLGERGLLEKGVQAVNGEDKAG